jgi:iron complex outermembrane recepter protein
MKFPLSHRVRSRMAPASPVTVISLAVMALAAPGLARAQSSAATPAAPAAAASAIPAASAASAAAVSTAPRKEAASSSQLGVITVTAQKRKERLQDVPAAASVVTAQDIERAGVNNIQDAAVLTPNLVITDQLRPGIQTVSFRGFTTVQGGQSPFAIVVDGVAQPGQEFLKTQLMDVQQIEVLRGPQGTLYGAGAIAGAINIVTKPPSDTLEGHVKVGVGNGNLRTEDVGLSGPLSQDLFYRVGVHRTDYGGLIEDTTTNSNVDFSYETSSHAQLLYKPNNVWNVDLRAALTKGHNGALWLVPVSDDEFDNWDSSHSKPDTDIVGYDNRTLQTYSAKVDYNFDAVRLTSITAFSKAKQFLFADGDYSSTVESAQTWTNNSNSVSQEFRLTSQDAGPLRWNAGVFMQRYSFLDGEQFGGIDNTGAIDYTSDSVTRTTSKSWALFGQASYDLTQRTELTLGMRYDQVHSTGVDADGAWSANHVFSSMQPKVSLAYKFNPDLTGYATYSRGFRTGGFNPDTPLTIRLYNNEVADNVEMGMKSLLLNKTVMLNAAVFATRFKNQQYYYSLATSDGIYRAITNIPRTDVQGVEADAQWRALPWLKFAGSLGYNDTQIKKFDTGEYNGNRVPQVYGLTTNLGVEVQHMVFGDKQIVARVDWMHRGDVYWDLANTLRTPPKNFFNARVALDWSTGDDAFWELALWGKNLTNEHTPGAVGADSLGTGQSLRSGNEPRQFGAELQLRF